MWEPRRLTTLWASMACYRANFTLFCLCVSLSDRPWRCIGEWRCSSTIPNLDTTWQWVAKFTPLQFCPGGKSPRVELSVEWAPVSFWTMCLKEKSSGLVGNRTQIPRISGPWRGWYIDWIICHIFFDYVSCFTRYSVAQPVAYSSKFWSNILHKHQVHDDNFLAFGEVNVMKVIIWPRHTIITMIMLFTWPQQKAEIIMSVWVCISSSLIVVHPIRVKCTPSYQERYCLSKRDTAKVQIDL
jgi:hypothetical protein